MSVVLLWLLIIIDMFYVLPIDQQMTYSIPRRPFRSHYLVCSKNYLFICDSRKYKKFCEGNLINNKIVGKFMYKIITCKNIVYSAKIQHKQQQRISYLDVKWNSMLIFNCSQALNRVNNKRERFGVRSPIEVRSTPRSGLGKSLTWTGYISVLTQFTWSRWIYKYIKISLITIGWPHF